MTLRPCVACRHATDLQAVPLCLRCYKTASDLSYTYARNRGTGYTPEPGTARAALLDALTPELLTSWGSRTARLLLDLLAERPPPSCPSDDLRTLLSAPHRADTPHRRARLARMELR